MKIDDRVNELEKKVNELEKCLLIKESNVIIETFKFLNELEIMCKDSSYNNILKEVKKKKNFIIEMLNNITTQEG